MAEPSGIGPGVTVVGTRESSGDVAVEGTVRGDIQANGNVTISAQVRMEVNLHATKATLRGHLLRATSKETLCTRGLCLKVALTSKEIVVPPSGLRSVVL